MLTLVEEIVLLLLRDQDGKFLGVDNWSLNYAVAGAVLMDLAMENRIDTDVDHLALVDAEPVGDNLLDPTLAAIASSEPHPTRHWVEQTAEHADEIREAALSRLVERGILERHEERILWVFRTRRYPLVDGKAEREVKLRIMEVLFSDEIPDPRDIMLICLVDACGIFSELLSKNALDGAAERIAQVRRMDLIGQAMTQAIRDIELSIAALVHPHMY